MYACVCVCVCVCVHVGLHIGISLYNSCYSAGGLCVGVGGVDAVDVMAGLPWELKCPKVCYCRPA